MGCAHGFKFDSEITHYLHELTGISAQDDEIGTTEDIGFHALFRGPFDVLADGAGDTDVISELDQDDIAELTACAGAILVEDGQGFVSAQLYDDESALDAAWQAIQDDYTDCAGPSEDDITSTDGLTWYQYGSAVLTMSREDDRDTNLRAFMQEADFFPNVWIISDHGNAHLLNVGQE